jgi:hypothetical protein
VKPPLTQEAYDAAIAALLRALGYPDNDEREALRIELRRDSYTVQRTTSTDTWAASR